MDSGWMSGTATSDSHVGCATTVKESTELPRHPYEHRAPAPEPRVPAPAAETASCPLRPVLESVKTARGFTADTLRRWGLSHLSDDLTLVVSELVTNALRHGVGLERGTRSGPLAAPVLGRPIELSLLREDSQVMCTVRDPSDRTPVEKSPDFINETGRGLYLVSSFSQEWGCTPLEHGGKVVWAVVGH
ncbi:anti-sigma regulatory factor (Ser/Thr protein kinase) [Allonocardiopsis opalescens]|uniref:Anti-sigma regulatory factor (Ser/Thr protein kinase) n=1 Tax=Allonocardiopsis opalescens TaxID=1144618 RepID=A0A2T0QF83_9ACTN|nr:anti-sigma regulatory factor (Ser/Thr protein kinase) [Allonocardiopsis opalescens]